MKILALLFSLTLPAQAILTVDAISGDENALHAEFTLQWEGYPTTGGGYHTVFERGLWEGGEWQFIAFLGPPAGDYMEAFSSVYLRNIWSDGWNPGPVHMDFHRQPFTVPSHTTDRFLNFSQPFGVDLGGSGLEYQVDAQVFGFFNQVDLNGNAHFIFDIERSTADAFRSSGPYLPQESVPEGGSTLLLFSPVLLLLLWGKRAAPHKTVQKC